MAIWNIIYVGKQDLENMEVWMQCIHQKEKIHKYINYLDEHSEGIRILI